MHSLLAAHYYGVFTTVDQSVDLPYCYTTVTVNGLKTDVFD